MTEEDDPTGLQILIAEICDALVPTNLKPPYLMSFGGQIDPYEHIISIYTYMYIIGVHDFLKCKLMVRTSKEAALRWYTSLPRFLVSNGQDLTRKIVHQFLATKHKKGIHYEFIQCLIGLF